MSAVETSPKQQILLLVAQMVITEQQFIAFNETIEKKLAEPVFKAKDVDSEPRLRQIYQLYEEAVRGHQRNLRSQYDLGRRLVTQVQETDALSAITTILADFQRKISPLLKQHNELTVQIKTLEDEIKSLISS